MWAYEDLLAQGDLVAYEDGVALGYMWAYEDLVAQGHVVA